MNEEMRKNAILQDLDIQWRDHFHMRDQTWKALTNSMLLFIGVVGLEIKGVGDFVLIPAYMILILTSLFGWAVASHHLIRQEQKFAFIKKYEEELGIFIIKEPIIKKADKETGVPGRIFAARFIEIMHIGIGVIGLSLLIHRILFA